MDSRKIYFQRFLTLEQRFWQKVDKLGPDECWEWTGAKHPKVYGHFMVGPDLWTAHRFVYDWQVEEIPDRMHVLHHCDNPSCVNPKHLFLGTNTDNVADRHAKGRSGTTMGRPGEKNSMSKLTQKQVDRIRLWYTLPKVTQKKLGETYGVDHRTISKIVRNERWTQ